MLSLVKICGLNTPEALEAALKAGADWVGFVNYPKSPRHIEGDKASILSKQAIGRAKRVGLVVNATNPELENIITFMDPDLLQLHGSETPDRVQQIKNRFQRPVIKALGIANKTDLMEVFHFVTVADYILLDAKPDILPGGNGKAFDWTLLEGFSSCLPVILSGGLTADNVGQGISHTTIDGVDVSSGVESAPGVKDISKIDRFVKASRKAFHERDYS